MNNLPEMHPDERANLELVAKRSLTNDEAQELARELKEWGMDETASGWTARHNPDAIPDK